MWLLCLLLILSNAPAAAVAEPVAPLAQVRRIFVDTLTGGDSALKIRDLLMSSLQNSKLFIITEQAERADAILKGAADETTFRDYFSSSDSINAHANVGTTGAKSNSTFSIPSGGLSVGENQTRRSEEQKHEAMITVRLVNKEGDVIWSTTQESPGGRFLGASADVADKVAKRLAADYWAAKQSAPAPSK